MSRIEKLRKNKNVSVVHERTREDKEPRKLKKFFPILIFILVTILSYLLFISSAFKISNVEIMGYGNTSLIENMVKNQSQERFYSDNIFLFDSTRLEEIINEDSRIKSVSVVKKLPQTIKVEIVEAEGKLIWNTRGENYLVDGRGYVIANIDKLNYPVIYDSLNIKVSLGERVASPTFIKFILDVSANFESITGAKIDKIIVYDIFNDVRVKSVDSWTVYLDASREPIPQLENLLRVIAEAESSGQRDLEYIDLRLPDRIFYK